MNRFLSELRRRKVFRTAAVYAVVAAGVWGAANDALPALGLPDSAVTFVVVATLLGFPVTVVLAWFFEVRVEQAEERVPGSDSAGDAAEASAAPTRRRWGLVAAGVVGVTVVTAVVVNAGPGGLAGGVLEEGARIVIAEFEAGEDGREIARAVRSLLTTELEHSPYVGVVPGLAVREALRRMERPDTTALTPDVALELALRDGHSAVLEGDVASTGSGWLVSVRFTDPSTGDFLLADSEALRDEDDVYPGIERLARRLREAAGESLRSIEATPSLPELTTSSLPALLAMDRARREAFAGRNPVPYFREALELDPDFVMAKAHLAISGARGVGVRAEAGRALAEAWPERARLAPGERAALAWAYHEIVTGDQAAGARAIEDYLRQRPDAWPEYQGFLALSAIFEGDWARAEELARPLLDQGPLWAFNLNAILLMQGRRDELLETVWRFPVRVALLDEDWDRAEERMLAAREEWNRFEPHLFDVVMSVSRGDLARFERGLEGLAGVNPGLAAEWSVFMGSVVDLLLRGDGRRAFDRVASAEAARSAGAEISPALPLWVAEVYAVADSAGAARAILARYDETTDTVTKIGLRVDRKAAEGRVLLAEGRPRAAVAVLEALRNDWRPWSSVCSHCYLATLGEAYQALGETEAAVEAFEAFLNTPWVFTDFRLHRIRRLGVVHERLGRLYETLGRPDDAVRHYAKLVDDWQGADEVLQPRVWAARAALDRLQREAGP